MLFLKEQKYLPLAQQIGSKYNVDPALILAHTKQESGFNPRAYRAEPAIHDASYGLMQILLGTARTMDPGATVDKLYNPTYNMDLGTQYIAKNLARYPGNIQDAIASYNAGSAYIDEDGKYVSKSGNDVQHYVDKVTKNYNTYVEWLVGGANTVDLAADPGLLFFVGGSFVILIALMMWRSRGKE